MDVYPYQETPLGIYSIAQGCFVLNMLQGCNNGQK